jgi:hypothetical protein
LMNSSALQIPVSSIICVCDTIRRSDHSQNLRVAVAHRASSSPPRAFEVE